MRRLSKNQACYAGSLRGFRVTLLLLLVLAPGSLSAFSQAPATTTTLTISPSGSVAAGTAVTLSATVQSGDTVEKFGSVVFCNAAAPYCEDTAVLGTAQITAARTATLAWIPPIGVNSVRAVFQSQKALASSSSSIQTVTATGAYPTTSAATLSGGPGSYTLNGVLTGPGGTPRGGAVSFLNGLDHDYTALTSVPLSPQEPTYGFVRATPAALGNNAQTVVEGDLNGDGKPDLAIVSADQILILLGNGDGTYRDGTPISIPDLDFPVLAAGDFNRDGKLDLVLVSSDFIDESIFFFAGVGDGTFKAATTVGTLDYPDFILAGDFNGDGKLDMAIATNKGLGELDLLLGNGDGTFTLSTKTVPLDDSPTGFVKGDFNGDGIPDLAVSGGNCLGLECSSVEVLIGAGNGTFTLVPSPLSNGTTGTLAVGDFNGDGIPDLAVTQAQMHVVSILLGTGNGNFTQNPDLSLQKYPVALATGDFNHDGFLDLAVADGGLTILPGLGNGSFGPPATYAGPAGGPGFAVADTNADGLPDVILVSNGSNSQASAQTLLTEQVSHFSLDDVSFPGGLTHQVRASYGGDANYAPSLSAPVEVPGTGLVATTTEMIPITTELAGQPFQATTTVTPNVAGGPPLTGTVALYIAGGQIIGTGTLSGGQVTISSTYKLAPGSYKIFSYYSGDANYLASFSAPIPVIVTAAPPAIKRTP